MARAKFYNPNTGQWEYADKAYAGRNGIYATPQEYGAKADGVTDDTAAINACLAKHDTVHIPRGTYMIDGAVSLRMRSNQTLILDDFAELRCIPNDLTTYFSVVKIDGVRNVTIKGGKIRGDKDEHLSETGHFGFGIYVNNAQNVSVDGCEIYDHWGDCIIIESTGASTDVYEDYASSNFAITNSVLHDSHRQGISVCGCIGFTARNVEIYGINGQPPESGIDFEPNHDYMYNSGCTLYDVRIHDCVKGIVAFTHETRDLDIDTCDILYVGAGCRDGLRIANSRIGALSLAGAGDTDVCASEIAYVLLKQGAEKVRFSNCLIRNTAETCLVEYETYDGDETITTDVAFDNCTFVTFSATDRNAEKRAFWFHSRPDKLAVNGCTIHNRHPNGDTLRAASELRICGCVFTWNYDVVGNVYVPISFHVSEEGGMAIVTGNTFDMSGANSATNDKPFVEQGACNLMFANNIVLMGEKKSTKLFNVSAGSGEVSLINNVFRQYANAGTFADGVTVTEIGNVYSGTTA